MYIRQLFITREENSPENKKNTNLLFIINLKFVKKKNLNHINFIFRIKRNK